MRAGQPEAVTMTKSSVSFKNQVAPCGHHVTGEHYQNEDDQGLVTDSWLYDCGCQKTRQEYHDGSMYVQTVRHDGRVLVDEEISEHGP
jgi:hypothetical protein